MEHVQPLIRNRRSCPEVGWGTWRAVETGQPSALALRYDWRGGTIVTVHNLADSPVELSLQLEADCRRLTPLFCDRDDHAPRGGDEPLTLDGYGFRWFRAHGERR